MPAQRSYRPRGFEDEFSIQIKGDLESKKHLPGSKSVYFTDQSPCFTIVAKNTADKTVTGKIAVRISFDQSNDDYEMSESQGYNIEIEPGDKETFRYELDMLSYQGSAAISVDEFRLRNRDEELEISKSSKAYRIYSFVVYDRDYYKVNYQRPRQSQYLSALLAVLIIAVGVMGL